MGKNFNTTEGIGDPPTHLEQLADKLIESHYKLMKDLEAARKANGHTIHDVARRLEIASSKVSKFETYDNNPSLSELRYYALAIGVVIEYDVKRYPPNSPE